MERLGFPELLEEQGKPCVFESEGRSFATLDFRQNGVEVPEDIAGRIQYLLNTQSELNTVGNNYGRNNSHLLKSFDDANCYQSVEYILGLRPQHKLGYYSMFERSPMNIKTFSYPLEIELTIDNAYDEIQSKLGKNMGVLKFSSFKKFETWHGVLVLGFDNLGRGVCAEKLNKEEEFRLNDLGHILLAYTGEMVSFMKADEYVAARKKKRTSIKLI